MLLNGDFLDYFLNSNLNESLSTWPSLATTLKITWYFPDSFNLSRFTLATFLVTCTLPVETVLLLGDLTVIEFGCLLLPEITSNASPKVSFTDVGIAEIILSALGELFISSVCADAGLLEMASTPTIDKEVDNLLNFWNLFTYLPIHPPSTVMVEPCR